MAKELIRMEHVNKFYGRVQALDDVNLVVNESEIVGLLGDNGAGKSTLIKVLSGAVPSSSGKIYVRGKEVTIRSTTDAIAQGIETIYQDSALVTQLSIARNLFLGREPIRGPRFFNRLDQEAMNKVARDLLARVGISKNIPPTTPIGSLSGGERQAVAIARAMYFDSDPPTTSAWRKRRACCASCAMRATRAIPASSSPTTSTTSSRWSTASWSCAAARSSPTTSTRRR
jgi:simple sugar transport system ATP-binding protein